jgi:hypothetical protein
MQLLEQSGGAEVISVDSLDIVAYIASFCLNGRMALALAGLPVE